jgi:hypothetical protein
MPTTPGEGPLPVYELLGDQRSNQTDRIVAALEALLTEQKRTTKALKQLVAFEKERRAEEARVASTVEGAATAIAGSGTGGEPIDLNTLPFYRTPEGAFLVRTPDGDRDPTPAEAAALRTTLDPQRSRRPF